MKKTELGKESRIWRNLSLGLPFEVIDKLGAKPGEFIQFFECGKHIVIEKVEG